MSTLKDRDSIVSTLQSVEDFSEELEYFGFNQLPSIEPGFLEAAAKPLITLVAQLVEVGWEVLQQYQVAVSRCEDADTHHHMVYDDNRQLQAQIQKLKAGISKKDKTIHRVSGETESHKKEIEKLQIELRKVKNEVLCLKSKLTHQEGQFSHTIRRKDAEIKNLTDQLQHRVVQNLPWKPRSPPLLSVEQEAVYKDLISKFEANNVLLVKENIVLRKAFYKLHTDLGLMTWEFKDLVDKHCRRTASYEEKRCRLDLPEVLSKNFYKLPHEVVAKEVGTSSGKYFDALRAIAEILDDQLARTA